MDLLRMDYINSLPHPITVRLLGDKDFTYPLHAICVETGCLQFDVYGLLEPSHISEIYAFKDDDGIIHDTDTFYSDYQEEPTNDQRT